MATNELYMFHVPNMTNYLGQRYDQSGNIEYSKLNPYSSTKSSTKSFEEENDELDKDEYELYFGKQPYEWVDDFGWNDLSNLWKSKQVSWDNEVTIHHPTHKVKLTEEDYHKYRRPYGETVFSAGEAPILEGLDRMLVHELRPDLKAAPLSLQELNLQIKYDEADFPTRRKISESIVVLGEKFIPSAKKYLELCSERKRFEGYMQIVNFW